MVVGQALTLLISQKNNFQEDLKIMILIDNSWQYAYLTYFNLNTFNSVI